MSETIRQWRLADDQIISLAEDSGLFAPVILDDEMIKSIQSRDYQAPGQSGDEIKPDYFIDLLDLGGKTMGTAALSSDNVNQLIADDNAQADDIVMLVSYIKQQVRDHLGVQLMDNLVYSK
ncbi:MAG: hypothetical protein ACKKL5_02010 [Candidatus Komeilibacteria bacterium]